MHSHRQLRQAAPMMDHECGLRRRLREAALLGGAYYYQANNDNPMQQLLERVSQSAYGFVLIRSY
jgi:hypothetical protein